jgi:hypothetical protein
MAGDESDLEIEELSECGDWVDEDLQKTMYELAVKEGDDPSDEDWLSAELMKRKRQNTGQSWHISLINITNHGAERPKVYARGPDVMSKSIRTQQRYRKSNQNQTTLDGFVKRVSEKHADSAHDNLNAVRVVDPESIIIQEECVDVEIPPAIREESVDIEIPPPTYARMRLKTSQ